MAFGRRRTTTVAGTGTGTGVTPVGTGTGTTRRRGGWRAMGRRRGAASTIASNKTVGGSKMKFTDMRAASSRRMSVAGAVIGEKFARLGADMKLGLYSLSHPIHPLRRQAAREQALNVKAAASERKRQKVARAVDVEMRKRAMVREGRAARLQTAL